MLPLCLLRMTPLHLTPPGLPHRRCRRSRAEATGCLFRRPPPRCIIAPHNGREVMRMDKTLIAALAKAAGLGKALVDHPEDVYGAAAQALNTAGAIRYPTDPAAEPWPPMRAGVGL
jgi:hypothetical protein